MRQGGRRAVVAALAATLSCGSALAEPQQESVAQTICRLIEGAAKQHELPVAFFTRLIWRESSFRPHVTSPAGAQGIAQFMPGTANERGLADPFDPEAAIPHSAAFLSALKGQFGNLGLAAAAYNGGPNRVARWVARGGALPYETQAYVRFITGRSVDEWRLGPGEAPPPATTQETDCLTAVASIRTTAPAVLIEGAYAPFGVQLAGNPSKARAVASYQRVVARFASLLSGKPTIVLGTPVPGRGRGRFYRVRLPAHSLREATVTCNRLRQAGGACLVLRN
ncbi:lytic transglycosylase domain-containing protein [Bosea sp. WAO]|uniref:lytic transglycosylase domain-containing protein n=1 Tax=Bosea sp. WAO TaxID=406341 RepID=UPI000832EACB|nr:lytic transglycosylase domain-containing protein [Bosea sp. WAO]